MCARQIILIAAIAGFVAGCSPSRDQQKGDIQVVAQWLNSPAQRSFHKMLLAELRIEHACGDICAFDGNDVGSGTYNLFLYTNDVPETVRRLVGLERQGKVPPGMRIAFAKYKGASRRDWDYVAVHPKSLKKFDIMYRKGASAN